MKTSKFIFGMVILIGLMSSCTNDSVSETEQLYDQQAIDKSEIKDSDV